MKTLQETVLEQMNHTPDALAVIFDDGSKRCYVPLTYKEMWDRGHIESRSRLYWDTFTIFLPCNLSIKPPITGGIEIPYILWMENTDISECLRDNAVSNEVVGVCIQLAINLPSVLLGILQTSSAFYPFGTDGQGFVEHSIHHLSVHHIIVDFSTFEILQPLLFRLNARLLRSASLLSLGLHLVHLKWESLHRTCLQYFPSLAYCITTSGTTGSPKIVRVPHSCIVPNIHDLRKEFKPSVGDITFLASPLTFDPSLVDIFVTLSSGAALLIVPNEVKMSPDHLLIMLHMRHRVTILQTTPTILKRFDAETLKKTLLGTETSLRILVLGGEKFPSSTVLDRCCAPTNTTTVYNIYGITEVSCWASLYYARSPRGQFKESVPIGRPLTGTVVKVTDEMGGDISSGKGLILIGSSERVCLLNNEGEELLTSGMVWRSTGDIGRVDNSGQIFCLGRTDRQIKRHGKRLNLDTLEQVSREVKAVELSCAVFAENQLHLFIVHSIRVAETDEQICREVRSYLKHTLPSHYHPDTVTVVCDLPANAHGKLDVAALISKQKLGGHQDIAGYSSVESMLQYLWKESLIKADNVVTSEENFLLSGGDSLKAVQLANNVENKLGCQIPQLLDIILTGTYMNFVSCVKNHMSTLPSTPPEKRGLKRRHKSGSDGEKVLLSFSESSLTPVDRHDKKGINHSSVSEFDAAKKLKQEGSKTESSFSLYEKPCKCCHKQKWSEPDVSIGHGCRHLGNFSDSLNPDVYKQCCAESKSTISQQAKIVDKVASRYSKETVTPYLEHLYDANRDSFAAVVSRGSQLQWINTGSCGISYQKGGQDVSASTIIHAPAGGKCISQKTEIRVTLTQKWFIDTGKCVDASPVVGVKRNGQQTVFIGSHSHKLFAVDMATGHEKWCSEIGDRIEGTACLSACGQWVIVGSYDHNINVFDVLTGKEWWKVQTKDVVKCTPATDPASGVIVCGSHDGCIYALSVKDRNVLWQKDAGGGGVFASPAITLITRTVYAATLSGQVTAMALVDGEQVWKIDLKKPLFSSPAVYKNYIYIGCVDGTMNCLDALSGKKMWTFLAKAPIFSSPTVCSQPGEQTKLLFGSHDRNLYCITDDGQLLWQYICEATVYATPFVFHLCAACMGNGQRPAEVFFQNIPSSKQLERDCKITVRTKNTLKNADVKKADLSQHEEIQGGEHGQSVLSERASEDQRCTCQNSGNICSEAAVADWECCGNVGDSNSSYLSHECSCTLHTPAGQLNSECKLAELRSGISMTACVATNGVVFIVNTRTGAKLGHVKLPGEVFSSPVVVGNHLVVGCRDNCVYCYTLTFETSKQDLTE